MPAPNHGSSSPWLGRTAHRRALESATHRATAWVNDAEVVSHEGGYTPFEADVSAHLAPGEPARITVVVNNTLSFQSIPPGVIEETPDGKRQRYWHDFFNYAGIHRTVWLYATPHPHLTDITVVTGLDAAAGTVDYATAAADAEEAAVHVVLRDADGSEVATGSGASGTLTVPNAHRWAPGDGYLYDLEVQLADRAGRASRQLSPERRDPNGKGGRNPVPHQRRTLLLHWLRQARGSAGDREGAQRCASCP